MSALFDAQVSLDASLAACARPDAALRACLDLLPSLLPCPVRAAATIDDATLLPAIAVASPPEAAPALAALLADAVDQGLFALALRRGQSVIHELPDGELLVLQAVATPTHLAGLLVGTCAADQAGAERLAALALAASRTGAAHEGLVLRARILAHADELERAVAERTSDLAAARDRAESSSRAKSAFLATVSHELRTPLNGIIGMAELLHADERDAARRDRLGVIRSCAEDLLRQIDSILDLSRIEAGRHELNPSEADPAALVMGVLRTLAPQAQAKGIELAWIPEPGFPERVMADAGRLRQVVMNLAGNALKFSASGSIAVRAAAAPDGDAWRLSFAVVDQGPGIAPEAQARLFTPFEQGDASINRRFGGSGLGLSISKRLCELMGGGIALRSAPGRGSTFTASVRAAVLPPRQGQQRPVRAALRADGVMREAVAAALAIAGGAVDEEAPQLAIVDGDGMQAAAQIDRLPHGLPLLLLTPLAGARTEVALAASRRRSRQVCKPIDAVSLAAALAELEGGAAAHSHTTSRIRAVARFDGARVLYADDQQVNRLVLAGQLRRLGVEVELVAGGAEAVQRAADGAWDMILLDCQMPEVDGFQAAARIREGGCGAPLVAVTAHAMAGDREECLLRGFDDYLAKPVRPAELADALARWVNREAAPEPPPAPPAVPERFAQLRAEVGDDIAREVLAAMLDEGPRLAQEAAAAAVAGDLATAGRRAHALKGDAGNLGFDELSGIARELEQAARAGDRPAAAAAAGRLGPAWTAAAAALRTALA